MIRPVLWLALCLGVVAPLTAQARPAGPPQAAHVAKARDLPAIRGSRELRVLVNQSRNSSGVVDGKPIGVEYHRLHAFERYLNGHAEGGNAIKLKIIPRAKEQLIAALQRGEGDLVAPGEMMDLPGNRSISATEPTLADTSLVLVGLRGERRYTRLEQLSGKTLALPAGSAAGEAVQRFNERLQARKLAPIKVEWVDPSLAVEDVLEMVNAKVYHLTLVEQPIAAGRK